MSAAHENPLYIKTIQIEDLIQRPSQLKISYQESIKHDAGILSPVASQRTNSQDPTGPTPLEDISDALFAAYQDSSWCYRQDKAAAGPTGGEGIPLPLYSAALRVTLMPWDEPPQMVAASFAERLGRVRTFAEALGVPDSVHQEGLVRALRANNLLAEELRLQHASIKAGELPGVRADDSNLSKVAYASWSKAALKEAEALSLRHRRLPECNGVLELSVIEALDLHVNPSGLHGRKLESFTTLDGLKNMIVSAPGMNPYVQIAILDSSGKRLAPRLSSCVEAASTSPHWSLEVPPVTLTSETCEILFKVKNSAQADDPSPGDKLIGRTGIKVKALPVGAPVYVDLTVYGKVPKSRGLCGCFGGGASPADDDDDIGAGISRTASNMEGTGLCVFNPERDEYEGVSSSLTPVGKLRIKLTHLAERRPRNNQSGGGGPDGIALTSEEESREEAVSGGKTYLKHLEGVFVQPMQQEACFRCRKTEVRPATSAVPQPAQSSPPFNVSPSVMFRLLAARMHSAHKAGKLDALRYSSVADSYVDDAHPMGGALSCDPFFASALQSIGVSHALSEVIFDDTVVPFLPFGWGLPLLLKFGRLYRIRAETQLLVLLQYMLLQAPRYAPPLLTAFKLGWEVCLSAYARESLTSEEVEGLKAVMGLFLKRAVPALHTHYTSFKSEEGLESFMLLLELVGWAWTWDPRATTPVAMFRDTFLRSARSRLAQGLRVTQTNVIEVMASITTEVQAATEDLQRDLEIQEALPGLESFAQTNCSVRYFVITDHLEMLFAYRPGKTRNDINHVFDLETAVRRHHKALIDHGFADAPGGVAVPRGDEAQDRSQALVLWDIEAAMLIILQRWVRMGCDDLKERCPRLLESETWIAASVQQRYGGSAVELQRMLNTALESWMEHCCRRETPPAFGAGKRRDVVGAAIADGLADVLFFYAQGFESYWEDMLLARVLAVDIAASAEAVSKHRRQASNDKSQATGLKRQPSSSTNEATGAPPRVGPTGSPIRAVQPQDPSSMVRASSFRKGGMASTSPRSPGAPPTIDESSAQMPKHRRTTSVGRNLAVRSITVFNHGHRKNKPSGDFGKSSLLPDADALADVLADMELGITLTDNMCTLMATLAQLFEDTCDLGESLGDAFREHEEEEPGIMGTGLLNALGSPTRPPSSPSASTGFGAPPVRASIHLQFCWKRLLNRQGQVARSLSTTYSVQYRDSLLDLLTAAFGIKPAESISTRALEGILSAVHEELTTMMRNLAPASSRTKDSARSADRALRTLVTASWKGLMSTLQMLALNQAGFRPLTAEESEWAREFLISLQNMYSSTLPPGVHHQGHPHDVPGGDDDDPWEQGRLQQQQQRSVSYPYCSALLQAIAADTSDLKDMYAALFSCLQHTSRGTQPPPLSGGGDSGEQMIETFLELGAHQVSLLDLLRLLRQRRKEDEEAQVFVVEQLRRAEAIATQVLFGLNISERLVAEFRCYLATGTDQNSQPPQLPPLPPRHPQQNKSLTSPLKPSGTNRGSGETVPTPSSTSSVQGRAYLTQHCLCYTTLLDDDSKGSSDTTFVLLRHNITTVAMGSLRSSVVITTRDQETYCLAGFAPGERDRLIKTLSSGSGGSGEVFMSSSSSAPVTPVKNRQGPSSSSSDAAAALHRGGLGESSPTRHSGMGVGSTQGAFESAVMTASSSNGGDQFGAGEQPKRMSVSGSRPSSQGGQVAPTPILSVPCHLYGRLINDDGILNVHANKLEFVVMPKNVVLHSVPLSTVEFVSQRSVPTLGLGSGTLMSIQVAGESDPLLLGGITEALIFHLKQTISDLCFESAE